MPESKIFMPAEFTTFVKDREKIYQEQHTSHKQLQELQKMAGEVPFPGSSIPVLGTQTSAATPATELAAVLSMLEQELRQIRSIEATIRALKADLAKAEEQQNSRKIAISVGVGIAIVLCLFFVILAVVH